MKQTIASASTTQMEQIKRKRIMKSHYKKIPTVIAVDTSLSASSPASSFLFPSIYNNNTPETPTPTLMTTLTTPPLTTTTRTTPFFLKPAHSAENRRLDFLYNEIKTFMEIVIGTTFALFLLKYRISLLNDEDIRLLFHYITKYHVFVLHMTPFKNKNIQTLSYKRFISYFFWNKYKNDGLFVYYHPFAKNATPKAQRELFRMSDTYIENIPDRECAFANKLLKEKKEDITDLKKMYLIHRFYHHRFSYVILLTPPLDYGEILYDEAEGEGGMFYINNENIFDCPVASCPICYEQCYRKDMITTQCNHDFCYNCIYTQFEIIYKKPLRNIKNDPIAEPCCPLCRTEFKQFEIYNQTIYKKLRSVLF